jgi:GNAT superfamily N-acetyltransferase
MANTEVVEVESAGQLKQFIAYPYRLYRGDKNFVPPLISERREFFDKAKNPFYRTARVKMFLALQDHQVVGRMATCINYKHNDYHQEKVGFFGFFDTIDDYEPAHQLLKVGMITLKKEGMEKMRGPMNFSTNHEIGFLVEGFDQPPVVMMPYNRPYQVKFAEKFGLKKVMDLLAYRITDEAGIPERIQRIVDKLKEKSNITVRSINLSDFDNEVRRIKEVYNAAWAYNWGFIPMDDAEFEYMAKHLRQIIDPDVVLLAEHENTPVAFSLALPDINQALIHLKGRLFPFGLLKLVWHTKIRNKVNAVRLITFGVVPEYQKRGIDSLMFVETYRRGSADGYSSAELSWVLESNDLMCRGCEQMGARLYKRYRIVEMPL